MKLLCIDGNSILNRAFYGIKLLATHDGRHTNAIQGFMNILIRLMNDHAPDAVAVAFDMRAKTFRHKMYDGYKATRKGMPEELAEQLPVLKKILAALGYPMIECEGYEADDILGTLARSCEERGDACLIATGDRDSLQLVSDAVTVLLTTTHFGRGETAPMTPEAVAEKYGVAPRQLIDVKALMGDASDNIPGVAGVGEKTATALIARFGSLDGVYEQLDDPSIRPGVRARLEKDRDSARLSYRLAVIERRVPIDDDPSHYEKLAGSPAEAAALLQSLELTQLIGRLGLRTEAAEAAAADAAPIALSASDALTGSRRYIGSRTDDGWQVTDGRRAALLSDGELTELLADETLEKYCADSKLLVPLGQKDFRHIAFDLRLAAYLENPLAREYSVPSLAAGYRAAPAFACAEAPEAGLLPPLCTRLGEKLEAEGMTDLLHRIEMPLAVVLSHMEQRGFLVDVEGIRRFGSELQLRIDDLVRAICTEAGRDFNLNSPQQLADVLLGLGIPLTKKTQRGYSTDAETLESLRHYPIVADLLAYRTYQKLSSTYVEGLTKAADREHRIHTQFNQTETRTGRISSHNPNLQNIPVRTELGSQLRRFFIAAPGHVLLDADYSQIELRVMAHMSGDRHMIEDFLSGHDIHTETAARVFGVERAAVTPDMRRRAKAVNFGIIYGIGAYSLAQDIGVSMREAARYIDEYLGIYSGVRDYLTGTVEAARRDGYVTTMYGRRRRLPELANANKQVQALGKRLAMNTPIQGTAADIIKIAMIDTERAFREAGLSARLILQIHDELIVEAPETEAAQAAALLRQTMEGAASLAVPLTVDVGQGGSWYDAKR